MAKMTELTPNELATLLILKEKGPFPNPSAVGFLLHEKIEGDKKPNPSPQGMALFAGKFLSSLRSKDLADNYRSWRITSEGSAYLEYLENKDFTLDVHRVARDGSDWCVRCPHCKEVVYLPSGSVLGEQFHHNTSNGCGSWFQVSSDAKVLHGL